MNVERLHAIALAIQAELAESGLVERVTALQGAITNQVNAPAEPSYQQNVATSLEDVNSTLTNAASNGYSPSWREVLDELGLQPLLGIPLRDRINEIFSRNSILPTVARDEITTVHAELVAASEAIEQLLAGLEHLKIGNEALEPGEAEVGVVIPRPAVNDELSALGKEFEELQRILNPFLELGASRAPLKVNTISSSNFAIYVAMAPVAARYVAEAVEKLLGVYKTLLEIRRLRQEMSDKGIPDEDLAAIDARANTLMATSTDAIADEMVDSAALGDAHRANELKIEIRLSLNALANRIDRGYNIDVRAEPEPEAEDDAANTTASANQEALLRIADLAPSLAYINTTGRPILSLPEGAPTVIGDDAGSIEPPSGGQ